MQTLAGIEALRHQVAHWRERRETMALVPTMGNLHAGHLALIERAKQRADHVVASIFVNPLQFDRPDDLRAYPRTLAEDRARLEAAGVELLFAPAVDTLYPAAMEETTRVEVPGLSTILCGAGRPGHFTGVATVVTKLFNIVQPTLAVFGAKDFQQLVIIRRLVADLDLPIVIESVPTIREPDGLALSSRNHYLDAAQRRTAPGLYQVLSDVAASVRVGDSQYTALQDKAMDRLMALGFRPDYVSVRRAQDLAPPGGGEDGLVVLAAAWLGGARLIDNISV